MNNTSLFQHKYLKYKNKYLILKNKMIQKGSGNPPFQCLVFGGGSSKLYGNGFYEVGDHATANYGVNQSWHHNPTYWDNLDKTLESLGHNFFAGIIDSGSLSWLNGQLNIYAQVDTITATETINRMCLIMFKYIYDEGIVCIEGIGEPDIFVHQNLVDAGFNIIGTIGFGKIIDNNYYTIYSKNKGLMLSMEDVNVDSDTLNPGTIMPNGYRNANPKFKYTKETSQIEFIKNRIINVYKDSGNTGPLITDTVNTEQERLRIEAEAKKAEQERLRIEAKKAEQELLYNDAFVCVSDSEGPYLNKRCENAK